MAGIGIDTRIYPDKAVIGNVFGGASVSKQYYPSAQSQDERLMWPSVSTDVAGMRRNSRGKFLDELEDDLEKKKDQYITFVRQNFQQMECVKFVPRENQNVKERRKLRCKCGAVLSDHGIPNLDEKELNVDSLIPEELKEIMSEDNRLKPPPDEMPVVKWNKETDFQKCATTSFGRINFVNVEYTGGKKPTKYIRVCHTDSVDKLITIMNEHWRIMEPREPHLCISVVGGAKNFKLDGRNRETFRTGLIKAAKTTDAWLISSGFNMGVMKEVGEAVSEGQSFTWEKDRMTHGLRCIAIAPWGFVRGRHALESRDGKGKFNADYKTSNSIPHGQPVPLNPDHTHFIFVDDGYRNNYRGVAEFRARFQSKVARSKLAKDDKGLGIPVVLVIVEGGEDTIGDADKCLEHDIPVVVCAGTGRAANILAYAYEHASRSGDATMAEKYMNKLGDKIHNTYGHKWLQGEVKDKTQEILEVVLRCCEKRDAIVIHNMNKHEELDVAILSALLKVKGKTGDQTEIDQRKNKLRLAMTWNRADIAQEEIFREDVLWPQGSLDDMLLGAIVLDKVEFVQLITKQGITMREFLTKSRLHEIYKTALAMKSLHTAQLVMMTRRLKIKDFETQFDLAKVTALMTRLMDKYDDNYDKTACPNTYSEDSDLITYTYPYKQLLIWAVLMDRQKMAKFFWEMGTEPINSAIAATRIYHRMLKFTGLRNESSLRETIDENKQEFEQLALSVLTACHIKDRKKAIELAETQSPTWSGMSSMEMAALAKDKAFLASEACQNSISTTWKRGIGSTWPRIILCSFIPFFVFTKVLEVEKQENGKVKDRYRIQQFYKAPTTKFVNELIMYAMFITLFTYMVLVDFKLNRITPIEIICVAWVCTFIIDDTYTALSIPSPTLHRKRRTWYTPLKVLDLLNFTTAIVGFIIHTQQYNQEAKTIYCINCISFCLRVLKTYTAHSKLGPKLVMIKNMIAELGLFLMILFVFLFAYGVSSQGLMYLQRRPDWKILKDVLYFPYWQLFGEIYLDELETDNTCVAQYNGTDHGDDMSYCRRYHYLVEIFLAGYLIIGNILLLNLLIAIFSNIFKAIDDNSIEIWKYQMYVFTMEYNGKSAFVPPFSIIEHIYLLGRWLFSKICCRKERKEKQFSKRHLEYLQLFEKEEMSTYLRKKKETDKDSEEKISKLQKRVDEHFRQLEEEFFAEAEDNRLFQNEIKDEMQKLKDTLQISTLMTSFTTMTPDILISNGDKIQNVISVATPKDVTIETLKEDEVNEQSSKVTEDIPVSTKVEKSKKKKKKKEKKEKEKRKRDQDEKTKEEGEMKNKAKTVEIDYKTSNLNIHSEPKSVNLNTLLEPKSVSVKLKDISVDQPENNEIKPIPVLTEQTLLTNNVRDPVTSATAELQKRMETARKRQLLEVDKSIIKEHGHPVYNPQGYSDSKYNFLSKKGTRFASDDDKLSDSDDSFSSDDNIQQRRRRHFRKRTGDTRSSSDDDRRRRRHNKETFNRENTNDYWYM